MKKAFTLAEVLMPKRTSGIKNEVLDSRESEGQGLLSNTIKHCAFTLAEVLITIVIIGVVAALTVPTVVQKFQQHELYTRFMKAYNTITTAVQLSTADNGDASTWVNNNTGDGDDPTEYVATYLTPYFKNFSMVDLSDIYFNDIVIHDLQGGIALEGEAEGQAIVFSDGSLIFPIGVYGNPETVLTMILDTNGGKGPNTLGRDTFLLSIGKIMYPQSPMAGKGGVSIATQDNVSVEDCCSTTASCTGDMSWPGITCPLKLIKDGKMDY